MRHMTVRTSHGGGANPTDLKTSDSFMANWRAWSLLLALILLSASCRRGEQAVEPSSSPDQPRQAQQGELSDSRHEAAPLKPSQPPETPEPTPPKSQRLNPAFPYPDGYQPEIRLDPPPVPPEVMGPSPPIDGNKGGKNRPPPNKRQ